MPGAWREIEPERRDEIVGHLDALTDFRFGAAIARIEYAEQSIFPAHAFCRIVYNEKLPDALVRETWDRNAGRTGPVQSYVLFASGHAHPLVPLEPDLPHFQRVLALLGKPIDASRAADWLALHGLVVADTEQGPFHFVQSMEQARRVMTGGDDAAMRKFHAFAELFFEIDAQGRIGTHVATESFPLVGKAHVLRIPTIYAGRLFISECRVSEHGSVRMDDDDPSRLSNLYPLDAVPRRLRIPPPAPLQRALIRGYVKANLGVIGVFLLGIGGFAASLAGFVAFLILLAALAIVGFDDSGLHQVMEQLSAERWFVWCCTVAGILATLNILLGWVIEQLVAHVSKRIPNKWEDMTKMGDRVTTEALERKLGPIGAKAWQIFTVVMTSLAAVMLLIFGISNLAPDYFAAMNPVESLMLIILSIPMIGPSFGWVFDVQDSIGRYGVYRDAALMYFASFVIVTIVAEQVVVRVLLRKRSAAHTIVSK